MQTSDGHDYTLSELFDKVYVYLYRDPKNNVPVYVGKGTAYRAWSHLGRTHNPRLRNLINKRTKEGFDILPEFLGFFEVDENESAFNLERDTIAKYGRTDNKTGSLFNGTDGGEGGMGQITNEIEFRGKTYTNRSQLCRDFGFTEPTVRARLRRGWTLEESLDVVDRDRLWEARPVSWNGETFPSIIQFANRIGLDEATVRHRLNNSFTPEEIADGTVRRKGSEIICGNKKYVSIPAFAEAIDKSFKAVSYWLETGWTPEEIVQGNILNRSAKYVDFRGKMMTMSAYCEVCNLSFTSLIKYRKEGKTLEEIYSLGQRPLSEKLMGKAFTVRGIEYSSLLDFNKRAVNINHSTLHKWINEFSFSPEECLILVEEARERQTRTGKSMRSCLSAISIKHRQKILPSTQKS
jgi:hypothetical protein